MLLASACMLLHISVCLQLCLDGDDVEMEPFITDASKAKKKKKKKKKLTLIQWVAAFQCYAHAADAAEVCIV